MSQQDLSNPRPLGAYRISPQEVEFRVWAPRAENVAVILNPEIAERRISLEHESSGYFAGVAEASVGDVYLFELESKEVDQVLRRPDPHSRFQPTSVHGASEIVDPDSYRWQQADWTGVNKQELVIYELHLGCFTAEGTYLSAIDRLDELVELGITAIELLPLAQAPGRWNWGYDGVHLFAPSNNFGRPDELKQLVDACHSRGLSVLLDVVYNHLGPEGNYLRDFGPYFSNRHHTPWGEAFNFDGSNRGPVRDYILANVEYWLREFRIDGLRLDAVHFLFDDSDETILDSIRQTASNCHSELGREIHLIAEANIFDGNLLTARNGQAPYDAIWCDCLMHSVYAEADSTVKLTRRPYQGAAEINEALQRGYLYESVPGIYRDDEKRPLRSSSPLSDAGTECDTGLERGVGHESQSGDPRDSLVHAMQTHDSVGNHPHGKRIHQLASIEFQKAAAPLFLLSPGIPMIFMGEESAVDVPFPFFVDFQDPDLRKSVDEGRANEYPQHAWKGALSPSDPQAFELANCGSSGLGDSAVSDWYRRLLSIRRQGVQAGWLCSQNYWVLETDCPNVYAAEFRAPGEAHFHLRWVCHFTMKGTADFNCSSLVPRPNLGTSLVHSQTGEADFADPGMEVALAANQAVLFVSN